MARLNFVFITVEHDADNNRWHAKLPYSDRDGASGAMGTDREDAVRNLYNVMDPNVILAEERGDQTVMWMRPLPAQPLVTIEEL